MARRWSKVKEGNVRVSRGPLPDGVTWPAWWHSLRHSRRSDGSEMGQTGRSLPCGRRHPTLETHIGQVRLMQRQWVGPSGRKPLPQSRASTLNCWWCFQFYLKCSWYLTCSFFAQLPFYLKLSCYHIILAVCAHTQLNRILTVKSIIIFIYRSFFAQPVPLFANDLNPLTMTQLLLPAYTSSHQQTGPIKIPDWNNSTKRLWCLSIHTLVAQSWIKRPPHLPPPSQQHCAHHDSFRQARAVGLFKQDANPTNKTHPRCKQPTPCSRDEPLSPRADATFRLINTQSRLTKRVAALCCTS